jgi:small subunit ribosomal protein S2
MEPFIFEKRGNIHIIDVKQTLRGLLIAKKLLAQVVADGQDVIFVGTKRQAQDSIEAAAKKCDMHFVSHRWLGGTLTNFRTIRSRVQRLEELETMEADGSIESESKKQASRLKRELRKIKTNLDGIRRLSRLPGAVVVVDAGREDIALAEARKLQIPTVGILDTDSDPGLVDVAIPANDDSIGAVELLLHQLADAVAVGKTMASARTETGEKPQRAKASRSALARANEKPRQEVGAAAKNESEHQPPAADESDQPAGRESRQPAEQNAEKNQ